MAVDPHLEKGYNNRGVIYLIQKQNDLALADFNKALAINPDMTDALNNRGSLYRTEKKYDLALADFNKALAISPTENAYINRGITYGFKGRNDLLDRHHGGALGAPRAPARSRRVVSSATLASNFARCSVSRCNWNLTSASS